MIDTTDTIAEQVGSPPGTQVRRRTLLQGAATAAGLGVIGVYEAVPSSAQSAVNLRVSVNSLALNSPVLNALRTGIQAMKSLPSSDPRNWTNQVNIHFNFCPHGNWYLLPWHRAYVNQFEKIIAQLSNYPSFVMPFWDWTTDRSIPAAFASPTYNGVANPLYDSTRTMSTTATLPDDMVGPNVINSIIAETQFEIFGSSRGSITQNGTKIQQNSTNSSWQRTQGSQGPLESNPHNRVHNTIGGYMLDFLHSPNDPLFWLHHSNIDRLWSLWNGSGQSNTTNSLWTGFPFTNNFVTASGQAWSPIVSSLTRTSPLGYSYTGGYGA